MSNSMPARFSLRICVFTLLIIAFVPALADEPQYDLRKVRWGMSIEEVKASEASSDPLVFNGSDFLFYPDIAVIANKPFSLTYVFRNNRLSRAFYSRFLFSLEPVQNMTEDNVWAEISAYDTIFELLKEKYDNISDEPAEKSIIWKDETYKKDQTKLAKAFILGHVFFGARWVTKRSIIILMLSKKDESTLQFLIDYTGIDEAVYQDDKSIL